jgi:hypothetical protein
MDDFGTILPIHIMTLNLKEFNGVGPRHVLDMIEHSAQNHALRGLKQSFFKAKIVL